jgi:ubiquinone/menaquinone biosynthesis C-methylase UbiE
MTVDVYDPQQFVEDHVFDAPGPLGWLTRRRKDAVVGLLQDRLADTRDPLVLDVGCGYGEMLADLRGCRRIGVDVNLRALTEAAGRAPDAGFALAAVERLPFPDETFDGVICSEVLEHLDRPDTLARELVRVTKRGGACCISVPNEAVTTIGRLILGKRPAKSPAHKQRFTPRSVAALFPATPVARRLTPIAVLPFAVSTNVVMLFVKP